MFKPIRYQSKVFFTFVTSFVAFRITHKLCRSEICWFDPRRTRFCSQYWLKPSNKWIFSGFTFG